MVVRSFLNDLLDGLSGPSIPRKQYATRSSARAVASESFQAPNAQLPSASQADLEALRRPQRPFQNQPESRNRRYSSGRPSISERPSSDKGDSRSGRKSRRASEERPYAPDPAQQRGRSSSTAAPRSSRRDFDPAELQSRRFSQSNAEIPSQPRRAAQSQYPPSSMQTRGFTRYQTALVVPTASAPQSLFIPAAARTRPHSVDRSIPAEPRREVAHPSSDLDHATHRARPVSQDRASNFTPAAGFEPQYPREGRLRTENLSPAHQHQASFASLPATHVGVKAGSAGIRANDDGEAPASGTRPVSDHHEGSSGSPKTPLPSRESQMRSQQIPQTRPRHPPSRVASAHQAQHQYQASTSRKRTSISAVPLTGSPSQNQSQHSPETSALPPPRLPPERPIPTDSFNSPRNEQFYSTYNYPPLDRHHQEIRLLEVTMRSLGGYRLSLTSGTELRALPPYSALSYCCGDPNDTKEVLVDGHAFNAFRSLAQAIDQAVEFWKTKYPGQSLALWVDQICINQSDPEERGHQVNFMRNIYQNAENVIVSLNYRLRHAEYLDGWERPGPEWRPQRASAWHRNRPNLFRHWIMHHDTRKFLRAWFPDLGRTGPPDFDLNVPVKDNKSTSSIWTRSKAKDLWEHQPLSHMLKPEARQSSDRPWFGDYAQTQKRDLLPFMILWLCIHEIVSSPWWRRAWIFQEFIMASRAWFLIDSFSISWVGLCQLLSTCPSRSFAHFVTPARHIQLCLPNTRRDKPTFGPLLEEFIDTITQHYLRREESQWDFVLDVLDEKRRWGGEGKLSKLLAHSCKCQATDPRDKVYAVIGLASPQYNIMPNYRRTNTVNRLLITTAQSLIITEKSLDILLLSSWKSRLPSRDDPLPTWVPDYAFQQDHSTHHKFLTSIGIQPNFDASPNTTPKVRFVKRSDNDVGSVLQTEGVCIATLTDVEAEHDQSESFRRYACQAVANADVDSVVTKYTARRNDEVWVFFGSTKPFIVRREERYCSLVGPAMLHRWGLAGKLTTSPVMHGRFATGTIETLTSERILIV